MSGRRFAFGVGSLSSDDDTSSEDFQQSSEEHSPPTFNSALQHLHYDEGSDDDLGEYVGEEDYEGRDSIQTGNDVIRPIINRPFGLDVTHLDKIQIFKNQMSLLEQSENRPQSYPLDYLLEEDEEIEDFNFDEDVEHDEGDEINEEVQQNAIPLEDDKEKSIEIDDGAIEVDEPFLKAVEEQQTVPAQESASLKGVSQEIPLKGFPQGHQIHRSFRVGWGPNGTLVIPRSVNFGKQEKKTNTDESPITIAKIQVFNNTHTSTLMRSLDEPNTKKQDFKNEIFVLEKHLHFSNKEKLDPNGLTYYTVDKPDDLIKVNRKGNPSSNDAKYQYDSEIWYLVETLWGTPKDIFGKTAFISPLCYSPSSSYVEAKIPASEYSYYLYRRNALSRWFSDTSSSAAEADLQKIPEDADTEEAKQCYIMFQYLSTKKISEAVDIALANKDFRFAALVSQAASNNALFKNNMHAQIEQWEKAKSYNVINRYRQYIYQILSGDIKSGGLSVDWKRGLALHFWYGRDVSMNYDKMDNLQLALSLYTTACKQSKANYPNPNYLLKYKQPSDIFDTRYHLLELFCHPDTYPIRTVLQPKGYTEHPLNYHLSWHLHKILKAVTREVMDFNGMEQWNLLDFQETMGHWEWAAYVLLCIYSPVNNQNVKPRHDSKFDSVRVVENALRELLARHAPDFVEQSEKRKFLSEELQIPETWIKAAEAIYYHYKKNHRLEFTLLLESEQWEAAHLLLMNQLLYQYLLRDNTDELMRILEKLSAHTIHLMDWPNKGGLFLNYLKLIERCKILIPRNNKRENEELIQELNKMLNKLQNWCSTKNSFNSETKYYRQSCFDDMSNTITTQISQIVKKESFNSFNRAQIDVQSLPNDLVKNHLNTLNSQFLYNIKKV